MKYLLITLLLIFTSCRTVDCSLIQVKYNVTQTIETPNGIVHIRFIKTDNNKLEMIYSYSTNRFGGKSYFIGDKPIEQVKCKMIEDLINNE